MLRSQASPSLEDIARELGLLGDLNALRAGWEESGEVGPAEGWPSEREVGEAASFARLDPELTERCLRCRDWVRGSPERVRLLWHCYRRLFTSDESSSAALARAFPALTRDFEEPGSLIGALICLCAVPRMRALHAERGIPEDVAVHTLRDLELWIHEHRRRTGRWGLSNMNWLRRHLLGRIVQLGRLQFELTTYSEDFHVYAGDGGKTVVLAGRDMAFRPDGQFADADGLSATSGVRTASFVETEAGWEGEGMDSEGFASGRLISISRSRWSPVLERGDPVIAVHIPAGGDAPGNGPMSPDRCATSFSAARELFPRHYGREGARAFHCTSWLLDPQLALYLPESSNIVRFQRLFHLLPARGAGPAQHFERVFGYGTAAPRDAAETAELERRIEVSGRRKTRVEQALLDHLRRGLVWRIGAGVIPLGDQS